MTEKRRRAEIVREWFACLGDGRFEAMHRHHSDDVVWELMPGPAERLAPWFGVFRGREGVDECLRHFAESVETERIEIEEPLIDAVGDIADPSPTAERILPHSTRELVRSCGRRCGNAKPGWCGRIRFGRGRTRAFGERQQRRCGRAREAPTRFHTKVRSRRGLSTRMASISASVKPRRRMIGSTLRNMWP